MALFSILISSLSFSSPGSVQFIAPKAKCPREKHLDLLLLSLLKESRFYIYEANDAICCIWAQSNKDSMEELQ